MKICWKALQRPVVSAQQSNTDCIVPDLIDFFGIEWKEIKTQIEKKVFIIVKIIVLTKNWFVVSNFWEFPKHPYRKIMFWPSVFATKNQG